MKFASSLPKLLLIYLLAPGCGALRAMDSASAKGTLVPSATKTLSGDTASTSVQSLKTLAMQAFLAPITTLHENTFKESIRDTLKKEREAKIGTTTEEDVAQVIDENYGKLSLVDTIPLFKEQIEELPDFLKDEIITELTKQLPPLDPVEYFPVTGHTGATRKVTFSSNNQYFTSYSENQIKIWNLKTKAEHFTLTGKWLNLSFSPDEQSFTTTSGNQIKVWDLATKTELFSFVDDTNRYWDSAFSPDGQYLVTFCADKIRVWNIKTKTVLFSMACKADTMSVSIFSPKGESFATLADNQVKIWDVKTWRQLFFITGHTGRMLKPVFSPEGQLLVTHSDSNVKIWDINTKTELFPISGHTGRMNYSIFSPNGQLLATYSDDQIKIWNIKTKTELFTICDHTNKIEECAFSPDGQFFVSLSKKQIKILDLKTGKEPFQITGHKENMKDFSFSLKGRFLSTISWGETKIWDIKTSTEFFTPMHYSTIWECTFDPDEKLSATYSAEEIVIWDLKTKKEWFSNFDHRDTLHGYTFNPKGEFFVSRCYNKIKIWALKPTLDLTQIALALCLQKILDSKQAPVKLFPELAQTFNSLPKELKEKLINATDHASPLASGVNRMWRFGIRCPICSENYDQIGTLVRLSCEHTICHTCLYGLLYPDGPAKDPVPCPICRAPMETKKFSQKYLIEHVDREKYAQLNPGKKL